MGFRLSVDDSIKIGVEAVQNVEFTIDTPNDKDARTSDVTVTLKVSGKILTMIDDGNEDTVSLAEWSMVPAEEDRSKVYRKVEVDVLSAGMVVRTYELENAFVVDYTETYGNTEGIGTYELIVRQKKDKVYNTKVTGGYSA